MDWEEQRADSAESALSHFCGYNALMDLLQRLRELEKPINYRELPPAGAQPFCVEAGTLPILLSAPHAAAHQRNGEWKMEEEFTAALARLVSAETGSHTIYATHASHEDPNWDSQSVYKDAVADIVQRNNIHTVIDLHGMTNRHNIGIALGTMKGRSIFRPIDVRQPFLDTGFHAVEVSQINKLSEPNWRRVVVGHPKFTGGLRSQTVTRFVSEQLGVSAVQVEVTSAARIVYRGPNQGWKKHYWGEPEGIQCAVAGLIALVQSCTT